jgi:hypothetical protein
MPNSFTLTRKQNEQVEPAGSLAMLRYGERLERAFASV